MNDAKRFLELVKTAAVEAVEQRYPVEFMFGVVIQEEDREKDRLAVLRIQGGQKYYILELLCSEEGEKQQNFQRSFSSSVYKSNTEKVKLQYKSKEASHFLQTKVSY